jgi:flagellar motor switch/type III secretory pathway protein FliN
VTAHVTHGVRAALCSALQRAGLIAEGQTLEVTQDANALDDAEPSGANPALVLSLQVRVQNGPQQHDSVMRAYVDVAHDVEPPCGELASRSDTTLLHQAPLAWRLVLAQALLPSRGSLSRLKPGDVVLLDAPPSPKGTQHGAWIAFAQRAVGCASLAGWRLPSIGQPVATAGPTAATATIHFERWLDAHERRAWHVHTQPGTPNPMDTTSDVPSNLTTALGDTVVSVEAVVDLPAARIEDLQSWTQGSVLRTTLPIDGNAVRLRVAGQTVGRGRLVAVESLIGVEVSELFD